MCNMKYRILTACLLVCSVPAFSQTAPQIEQEQWSGQNGIQTIDARYNNESAVILFRKKTY